MALLGIALGLEVVRHELQPTFEQEFQDISSWHFS
jgi:hypothetical protein